MQAAQTRVAKKRLVHLAEGSFNPRDAKMATGVIRYGYHESVAVIDSGRAGQTAEEAVGCGGEMPIVGSLEEALKLEPRPEALLIGVTPTGGQLPKKMRAAVLGALAAGLDVFSGLHEFLADDAEIAAAAEKGGGEIWDIRRPRGDLQVGAGRCREAASYVALTVGTDCAVGKMTTAVLLAREAESRGVSTAFVATGQVGIAIAGWGSPVDAIPGDFMSGAVEKDVLSVDAKVDSIFVEGQGSLLHPGFSPVTLGLLHGACPDAVILCHDGGREGVSKIRGVPFPPLQTVGQQYLDLARPIKPTRVAGVSLNTFHLSEGEAKAVLAMAEHAVGVPAVDPIRDGVGRLVDALEQHRREVGKV